MTEDRGIQPSPAQISSFGQLLRELERLRVRAARGRGKPRLSLQDMAEASGIPKSTLANYLSGATLIPADQLDSLVLALGATPQEAAAWAGAWERAMARRLAGEPAPPPAAPPTGDGPTGDGPTGDRPTGDRPAAAPAPGPHRSEEPAGKPPRRPVVPKLPRRAPGPAADRRRTVALLVGAPLGLLAAGAVVAWALASLGSGGDPGPGPGGGSTTVSPPEAQSCQGKGCENQDPERTGCAADAQTATAASHPTMIVYVRYSPSCRAAWGRITNAQPGNVVTVFGTDGASARQAIRFGPDVYSPMIGVPAGSQVWVCGASKTFQLCTSRWRPPAPTSPGS